MMKFNALSDDEIGILSTTLKKIKLKIKQLIWCTSTPDFGINI